jgi:RimJ/RimL family protein N-acetyltransferase
MISPQELTTPTLQGVLVNLVQLDQAVLEPYLEMLSDPEGRRLTATKAVFSREQIVDWLSSRSATPGRKDWAIVENGTGEFAGEIVLNDFDEKKNSMNLRIALRGSSWFGRGLGGEARLQ